MIPSISPRDVYVLTLGSLPSRLLAVGLYLLELPYPPYAEGLVQIVYVLAGDGSRTHAALARVLRHDEHGLLIEQRTPDDEPVEVLRFTRLTRALFESFAPTEVPGVDVVLAATKLDTHAASEKALHDYFAGRTLSEGYFRKFDTMSEIGDYLL